MSHSSGHDPEALGMAAIAATVAALATFRPRLLLRLLLMDPDDLNGPGTFALRLFATRNAWVVARTLRGKPGGAEAYLPIQALDQAVFWHAGATGLVRRRSAALAAALSGVIVALGLRRRAR